MTASRVLDPAGNIFLFNGKAGSYDEIMDSLFRAAQNFDPDLLLEHPFSSLTISAATQGASKNHLVVEQMFEASRAIIISVDQHDLMTLQAAGNKLFRLIKKNRSNAEVGKKNQAIGSCIYKLMKSFDTPAMKLTEILSDAAIEKRLITRLQKEHIDFILTQKHLSLSKTCTKEALSYLIPKCINRIAARNNRIECFRRPYGFF